MYDLSAWMKHWGWQWGGYRWEKRSPYGLICACQGDVVWEQDYQLACTYESQLIGTSVH